MIRENRSLGVIVFLILLSTLGNHGCADSELSREEAAQQNPSHPTQVTVEIQDGGILLRWLGTGDDRVQHYQIYRKTPDADWQPIMQIKAEGDNSAIYDFLDKSIEKGGTYVYGISAINGYGRESTITESSSIVAR